MPSCTTDSSRPRSMRRTRPSCLRVCSRSRSMPGLVRSLDESGQDRRRRDRAAQDRGTHPGRSQQGPERRGKCLDHGPAVGNAQGQCVQQIHGDLWRSPRPTGPNLKRSSPLRRTTLRAWPRSIWDEAHRARGRARRACRPTRRSGGRPSKTGPACSSKTRGSKRHVRPIDHAQARVRHHASYRHGSSADRFPTAWSF